MNSLRAFKAILKDSLQDFLKEFFKGILQGYLQNLLKTTARFRNIFFLLFHYSKPLRKQQKNEKGFLKIPFNLLLIHYSFWPKSKKKSWRENYSLLRIARNMLKSILFRGKIGRENLFNQIIQSFLVSFYLFICHFGRKAKKDFRDKIFNLQ